MKKLFWGVCILATCCRSESEAMYGSTDGINASSIVACRSGNHRCMMITRWEYDHHPISSYCNHLCIEYIGIDEQINKKSLTQETKDRLCTLNNSIDHLYDLRVLSVYGYNQEISLKVLPKSIGNLRNLRILDLSGNQLKNLPDSIGNLKKLKELNLSGNRLLKTLPESIGNLEDLEVLNLDETNLDPLPESLENLTNLEDLTLSKFVIKSYTNLDNQQESYYSTEDYPPDWYYNFVKRSFEYWSCPPPNPKTLSLDLSKRELKQIPLGVYMLKELQELDISGNLFTKISPLLKKLKRLRLLSIYDNPNLKCLPDFLDEMRNLEEVRID